MKSFGFIRGLTIAALLISLSSSTAHFVIAAGPEAVESPSKTAIRLTPPAPVFDDNARRSELAERRARVAKQIGPQGVLVMFSAEPRIYTNDVDYEYRQENNLYYL
ncbi:MAG: aminopeptidase P N-terminal domain-containing protein, partial [Pyrinomonadaceae bacterium]